MTFTLCYYTPYCFYPPGKDWDQEQKPIVHNLDNHELAAAFYHIGPLPFAQHSEDVHIYTTVKLEGP